MSQITIESKFFNRALAVVSKLINRRNTFPILDNVLLSRVDGQFFLTGSNGEAWGKMRLPDDKVALIEGKDFCSICLPAETLRQVIGSFPDQRLVCDIDEDSGTMCVRHLSGHFSIPVTRADEYPVMPVFDKPECQFTVDGRWFVPRVKVAKSCVGDNPLRPQMSNIALIVGQEGMDMVGTDGQTLFKDRLQVGVGTGFLTGEPRTVLLHLSVLGIIETAFQSAEKVTVQAVPNNVMLSSDEFTLSFRPVDGKYPNYNSVIPKSQPSHVSVAVSSLIAALRRVAIFASESSNMVVLSWKDGKMTLEAKDIDFSQSASETVAPASEDSNMPDGFRIGMKAASLLALLYCVNTDNAILEFSESNRPVTIREEDVNSHRILLQMPMVLDE